MWYCLVSNMWKATRLEKRTLGQSCGHRVSWENLAGFVQGTCRRERSREGGHSPVRKGQP